jgi:hypothetical protein
MRIRIAVTAVALTGLLAGCADVVNGTGTAARAGGTTSPDFGAPSGATVAAPTPCPHVTYAQAKLSFDCIDTGFTPHYDSGVWPLRESKTVEAATGWVVEEGAGHWGTTDGQSLTDIASNVRDQMVEAGDYGDNPTVSTIGTEGTVGGAKAATLEVTFTLDPTWAKTRGTKVEQEKLWLIAIEVGTDDVSLWYTSIPDLARSLWAKVPSIIDTIEVS